MKKLKKIPEFKNEKEEREFWQKVDSTEYVDYSDLEKTSRDEGRRVFEQIIILQDSGINHIRVVLDEGFDKEHGDLFIAHPGDSLSELIAYHPDNYGQNVTENGVLAMYEWRTRPILSNNPSYKGPSEQSERRAICLVRDPDSKALSARD